MLSITASMETKADPGTRYVYLTLEEAVTNPALMQVMYDQINSSFLGQFDGEYTITVLYLGITVYITDSYDEWVMFFNMKKLIGRLEMIS